MTPVINWESFSRLSGTQNYGNQRAEWSNRLCHALGEIGETQIEFGFASDGNLREVDVETSDHDDDEDDDHAESWSPKAGDRQGRCWTSCFCVA